AGLAWSQGTSEAMLMPGTRVPGGQPVTLIDVPVRSRVFDGILQGAQAGDLEPARVPRLQEDRWLASEPDTGRRARGNEIAGRQRDEVREIAHEVADVEDERLGVAVLHLRAVHPQLQLQDVGIANLRLVRAVRPHRRHRVAALARGSMAGYELEGS